MDTGTALIRSHTHLLILLTEIKEVVRRTRSSGSHSSSRSSSSVEAVEMDAILLPS